MDKFSRTIPSLAAKKASTCFTKCCSWLRQSIMCCFRRLTNLKLGVSECGEFTHDAFVAAGPPDSERFGGQGEARLNVTKAGRKIEILVSKNNNCKVNEEVD